MKYLIRVNYKSGIQEEIWVDEFSINGPTISWKATNPKHRPIMLGVDHVESVWQLDIIEE